MYTVPAQSIVGRLLSNPGVNASYNNPDVRPDRPPIHTDDVEGDGEPNTSNNVGFESVFSSSGAPKSSYDALSTSLPQSFPRETTLSPAAMFLSGFSGSPSILPLPDDEGEVVAGYILGPTIGYGGFSIVRRASSTSGGVVAVKIVRHSDLSKQGNIVRAQKRLDRETHIWASLNHEHILPLFTSMHNSYADFFVTLYCPAGSLFDILKREGQPALPQDDVGLMFRQLVRGIRYLHEDAGIVHRDLKLENVLVDESGTCKITDFGMAWKIGEVVEADEEEEEDQENADGFVDVFHGVHRAASVSYATPLAKLKLPRLTRPSGRGARHRNSTTTSMPYNLPKRVFQPGSLPYAAPELLLPPLKSEPCSPHPAQDMWALGVMLYALLSGRLPFPDSFEPRLQMKIMHGVFDMPSGVGQGTERLLQGLMDKNAVTRWTIAMVDEVAWGVGWGDEGGSIPVTDEELRRETSASSSRSHSRPHISLSTTSPISEVESDGLHSAGYDASARRSASRAKRSLSRAPISARRRSLSKRGEQGRRRSSSHHQSSTPTSALEPSILSLRSSSTHSSLSSSDPMELEYALLASPSPLRGIEEERGRRLKKSSHITSMSRSPSPSVLPSTPSDVNPPRFFSPPLSEERAEGSRISSRSIPRGRVRLSRLTSSHQMKSDTHIPLERHSTPDVFSAEDEPEWHISSDEDGLLQNDNEVDNDMSMAGMAMDQDYLTSSESYFPSNTSPPPTGSESHARPIFPHRPGSIVQTKSERSGRSSAALASESSPSEISRNDMDHMLSHSSSSERSHHVHHHHHPYNVKKQMRAGSTPPAPFSSLSDNGRTSALRFAEHKSHSHSSSASHTPFSVYSHSHSSSRTSFGLLASEQTGSIRAMPVSATITPVVVSGVTCIGESVLGDV